MGDEMEYQSIVSTSLSSPMDCGSEYERTSFAEDGYEYQPTSSEEDGSQFYPSSSKEDESDSEPPQPHKNNNDIHMHQTCVTLNHHHLRSDTELEVGSVISKGQTWELHDGSFLMITELGRSRNSLSVEFFGHLFRPIEEFRDYLPVKFSGSELVWLCEAKEHESKPRSYLRSACSRDVLRIRQLVLINSKCSPQPFTDPRTLVCQWKLVAELSRSHATSGPRGCKSFESGSLGQPKAFAELSSQDLLTGGNLTADKFHSQHHLHSDPPEASSDEGPSQPPKKHGLATYRNLGTSKERCQDTSRSLLLAPSTNGNRIAKATRSPGKSPCRLEIKLACMLALSSTQRTVSEQSIEPQIYTFADAFCGAGGMSVGAKAAALRIEWAFDEDKDAIDTYSWNHGKDTWGKS